MQFEATEKCWENLPTRDGSKTEGRFRDNNYVSYSFTWQHRFSDCLERREISQEISFYNLQE